MLHQAASNLLTEANLGQHNDQLVSNVSQHTIALIRQEATQKYERSCAEDYDNITACVGSIESLPNLYRPTETSNDSPMKRFLILSTANEPTPVIAKAEMRRAGICYGSLLTVDARSNAAATAAATTMAPLEVDSDLESDTAQEVLSEEVRKGCRRAGALPTSGLVVARAPTMRKGMKKGDTEEKRQR